MPTKFVSVGVLSTNLVCFPGKSVNMVLVYRASTRGGPTHQLLALFCLVSPHGTCHTLLHVQPVLSFLLQNYQKNSVN